MRDFLKPEIVLFGVEDKNLKNAKKFYRTLHHQPFYETTIENPELIKVCYNTFYKFKNFNSQYHHGNVSQFTKHKCRRCNRPTQDV